MKKIAISLLFFISLSFLFADFSPDQKAFVSSSLQDKVGIVKKQIPLVEKDVVLIQMALDFCLENAIILSDSQSIYDLLFTSLFALPQENLDSYANRLKELFFLYDKEEIRIEIVRLFTKIQFVNKDFTQKIYTYIFSEIEKEYGKRSNKLINLSLQYLACIQEKEFFTRFFPLLSTNIDFELKKNIEDVLASVIEIYKNELILSISNSTTQEKKLVLDLLDRNTQKNLFFEAEIAENLLRATIIYIGDNSEKERESLLKEFYEVQIASLRIIQEAKWTKAARLVADYFEIAVEQYNAFFMSKNELLEVMDCLTVLATSETGKALSDFLAVLNKKTESTGTFDEALMLHLISSLSQLGEKTAFDNLLYVILHEGYPDSIVLASKEALAKLNW